MYPGALYPASYATAIQTSGTVNAAGRASWSNSRASGAADAVSQGHASWSHSEASGHSIQTNGTGHATWSASGAWGINVTVHGTGGATTGSATFGGRFGQSTETTYILREQPIRRERVAPFIAADQRVLFLPAIQIEVRPGVGRVVPPGTHPRLMLAISFDGGYTFSPEVAMEAGVIGDYLKRMIVRQLGFGRNIVVKVAVSDPVQWDLIGAYFDPPPIAGLH